ncbi:histidine--tRNA ligase [Candidatus Marinamargulisbacteria bacterium SCGC AG-410-N11]|nr:histidine--tRNA ligase [Candidatus Marinamargulisbacteria bacterium SCGC AG-410-N11]
MKHTIPRGTKDILPSEMPYWHLIESNSKKIFNLYGYQEIRTPIFENTPLFERGIGQDSDIVKKEMYTFIDKGDRSITLRPEGTAPVARSFINNGFHKKSGDSKLYYCGPMFRYERPQAGRYRQFHQIGIENIGTNHPSIDAETIAMAYHLFESIGLTKVKVLINSIGSQTCRPQIESKIKEYIHPVLSSLSEDNQDKVMKNPLRILDSKDPTIQSHLKKFPDIQSLLRPESQAYFKSVLSYLDAQNVPYQVTPTLVRGLDYYTETVFEIISDDLGAQNTICGGGRYNNLIKELGGQDTPAFGFAFGVERMILILEQQNTVSLEQDKSVFIAPIGKEHQNDGFKLANHLRRHGIPCMLDFTKNDLSPLLKKANKTNARFTLISGQNEVNNQTVILKDMKSGNQETIDRNKILETLTERLSYV